MLFPIQEQIVEVLKAMTTQMTDERKGIRAVTFATTEQIVAVPVPQIQEQIVDVPVPQIMEGTIEVAKLIPQESIQRRTLEETVSVPLPQIHEQILEAVKALFDRR